MMESISRHDPDQRFEVLGLPGVYETSLADFTPCANVTTLDSFLDQNPAVRNAFVGRSEAEQFFTTLPSFLDQKIRSLDKDDWLIYVDADIYFYQPLSKVLPDDFDASVFICPHRHYAWNRRRLSKYGQFNVGLVAFRNDSEGKKVLSYWAESCLNWCMDVAKNGLYADQKYLEHFPYVSKRVAVDGRVGSNLAPWNSDTLKFDSLDGTLKAGGSEVLYFHMQGLRRTADFWYLGHLPYFSIANKTLRSLVYWPYLKRLEEVASIANFEPKGARKAENLISKIFALVQRVLSAALRQRVPLSDLRNGRTLDSN